MQNPNPQQTITKYQPFDLKDTSHLTPDNPDFYKADTNIAILTKYGRGIYIRHGNEDRCSSFFATLGTIVNKLQLSFGKSTAQKEEPATLKCIKQGVLTLYLLRRLNFMYICWSKTPANEVTLMGMIEYVHHQLMSCLTGKVNQVLQTNQTYDPSVNFGKFKTEHQLLHYAFHNGLHSPAISFNAIPVMPLPMPVRSALAGLLRQQKIQGLQINIIMTMGQVVFILKEKGIDITCYDIFLLNTLMQSQSALFKSEIWSPICLPGVSFEDRVFCYINALTDKLIHIMVSDQADIFPELSKASKDLKAKLEQSGLISRINLSSEKYLISDPTLEKSTFLKHFIYRFSNNNDNSLPQIVMSHGRYFGYNERQIKSYLPHYSTLHRHYSTHKTGKKQKIHLQTLGNYIGGYCEEGTVIVFFICGHMAELQDCRQIGVTLSKFAREQDSQLWLHKFI